jgi:hypothetical protein
MLLTHHQTGERYHDIRIGNRSFENVAEFKYMGMTTINVNLFQEELEGD